MTSTTLSYFITEHQFCNKAISPMIDSRLQAACIQRLIANPTCDFSIWKELYTWLVPAYMSNGYHDAELAYTIWTHWINSGIVSLQNPYKLDIQLHILSQISLFTPPKTKELILKWISDFAH